MARGPVDGPPGRPGLYEAEDPEFAPAEDVEELDAPAEPEDEDPDVEEDAEPPASEEEVEGLDDPAEPEPESARLSVR